MCNVQVICFFNSFIAEVVAELHLYLDWGAGGRAAQRQDGIGEVGQGRAKQGRFRGQR